MGDELDEGIKRLRVLADPERLRIAACLLEGSWTAAELAQQLRADVAAVMDHLQVMSETGFVQCEGEGPFALYSFRSEISLAALGLGEPGTINFGCCKLTLTPIRNPDKPE